MIRDARNSILQCSQCRRQGKLTQDKRLLGQHQISVPGLPRGRKRYDTAEIICVHKLDLGLHERHQQSLCMRLLLLALPTLTHHMESNHRKPAPTEQATQPIQKDDRGKNHASILREGRQPNSLKHNPSGVLK